MNLECITRTMRKVIKDYIKEVLPLNYFSNNAPSKILPNVILVWGFAPEQAANKKNLPQKGFGICPYLRSPAADYFIHHGGDLDKLIKKHKLFLLPTSMYLALCLLLGVCAIYTKGDWFFIVTFAVLFGLSLIFTPIYIAKYDVFNKIKKYNDFVSIGLDFILLNVLLVIINLNTLDFGWWYIKIALPIVFVIYLIINILLSVRFIKTNRFVKTGIILFLINVFIYVPPMLINVKNIEVQKEIDQANILNANFSDWQADGHIENNIHLIVALSLLTLSIIFFGVGIMKLKKKTNQTKITL